MAYGETEVSFSEESFPRIELVRRILPISYLAKPCPHALPVELVRIIFETAACQSRDTAASLCRVSKSIQKWITPLLYEIIVIEETQSLHTFNVTVQSTSLRVTGHTTTLYLPQSYLPTVISPNFLKNFPALVTLALNSLWLQHPSPSTTEWLSPRPFSITITGSLRRVSFDHPIFRSCTHLYLADDVPRPFALTADTFPHLTHLACGYRHGTSSTTAFTCLPLLLAQKASEYSIPDSPEQHYTVLWGGGGGGAQAASPGPPVTHTVELEILVVNMYLHDGSPDTQMFSLNRLGLGKAAGECLFRADPRLIYRPGGLLTAHSWEDNVVTGDFWTTAEEEVRLLLLNTPKDDA